MSRAKIVVCRDMGEKAMGLLTASDHEVVVFPGSPDPPPRSWVLENIKGAAGICVMMADKANQELLDAAGPSLKVVSTFSVGHDHIDVNALQARDVRLGYTPDVLNDAVADLTVMLALMAMRRAKEGMDIVHKSQWPQTHWSPFLLTGPSFSRPKLTLGFLGFGRISHSVLSRFLSFTLPASHPDAPKVIYTSSHRRPEQDSIDAEYTKRFGVEVKWVEKEELARESDVLIVLCNLNESTKGIVGKEFLSNMKETAVLVNTARGAVVDSHALAEALDQGKLFAAGVDVVDGEPNVKADHPLVKQPRCVVLPHVGSATWDSREGMALLCAKNVLAGVQGEELPAELK
ncbi:hypothetical protein FFLO_06082 [Filobasidium floriforme]|uniref:Glyoxylate reductase n=1 Tax=Filobasidium floriforme TaxID=5210 RepID=A0A8K0JG17_9TREE|nr:uncharacterized protein HD553DRAFT_341951 [Filobasidium floriforme]KAG7528526.1 hypothetical protein FFLO_06082 [Filobasidium floriforme]KAH8085313.1 hypothetical protein HD553DRAFT_341951 [Filobasidium floriforme]